MDSIYFPASFSCFSKAHYFHLWKSTAETFGDDKNWVPETSLGEIETEGEINK